MTKIYLHDAVVVVVELALPGGGVIVGMPSVVPAVVPNKKKVKSNY